MKKFLSLLLTAIIAISIFAVPTSAAEADVAEVGAPTQAEAINWLNNQVGKKVGSGQCVALIKAYYELFGYGSYAHGNGCDYDTNTLPAESGWTRIKGGTPQTGDILVWTGGYSGYGHVAICGGSNQYFHQNWSGQYVQIINNSYTNGFTITSTGEKAYYWGIIRPKFGDHTHSYTTHSHYGSAHPHYKYNKCSCGATQATSTTSNVATCTQCPISNPWIKISRNTALSNESIVFTFGADNATSYDITIKQHDTIVKTATNVKSGVSYSFTEEGGYTAYITAKNGKHTGNSSTVTFYVVDALDFGSYFVAKLNNPVSGYYVSAGALGSKDNYPNVYLASETSNSNNEWIFIRQEDRSYKVVNKETGYCLDVSGGSHHNGTNIGCYPSNDTVSQRWYIRKNISGYALVPKLILSSDLSIAGNNSIYGECIFDGANIALYGNDSVQSQRFVFEYTIEPIEEWLEIDKTYVTSEQEITFNFGADYVQKYTIHIEHEFGDIIEQDIDSGDSLSFDETGLYTAYVICTLKDGTEIKTDSVSFYNMIVYDFGDEFDTKIRSTTTGFYVATDESKEHNVLIASEALNQNNVWNFERQDDGSYEITNTETGYVLDLAEGKVEDRTNIICTPDNDSDTQRWYITKNISGYALAPKKDFTKYLSVFEHDTIWWYGDHADGANILLYDLDNVESQRFEFVDIKPNVLLGDVDADGKVTIKDATAIQKHVANLIIIDEDKFTCADTDKDNKITIKDATLIQKFVADIISQL